MKNLMTSLLTVVMLFVASFSAAQESAIEDVISGQIEAFQSDDFARAFTYASPVIQQMFQTPQRFGEMVQRGYPMVWRPADVQFLDSRTEGSTVWQRVQVRDANGQDHWLGYQMVEMPTGWKINGVVLLKAPDVGT